MLDREKLISIIIARDRKIILSDASQKAAFRNIKKNSIPIIADFTEYSPLHKGHRHCMKQSQKKVPEGLFVAVVPGPTERSGRGLPYIMTREARAQAAIAVGADIVVEGPPMGIMGSGQYSICLARMFKALDADYIPRGYKPVLGFEVIMDRISKGHGVAPKPYKMMDMHTREVLMKGKLEEDNYVIASLSRSLTKIGFDFKNKFIFVERIPDVSGTLIRQAILKGEFKQAQHMLPSTTIDVLQQEMDAQRAPLHNIRDKLSILKTANEYNKEDLLSLALLDDETADKIIKERPIKNLNQLRKCISWGFSTHFQERVLSALEAKVDKETISKYIENYPSLIRVLNYKDEHVLQEFKDRIPHRRIELWQ